MKVAVYLMGKFSPSLGGNFSYHEKFIYSVDTYNFKNPLEVCFVGRVAARKIKLQKQYVKLAPSFVYFVFNVLNKLNITPFLSRIFFFKVDLCSRFDTYLLRKNNIDVVLFPGQFLKKVSDFPFITMNWDAGHKTTFAFPELLENFGVRERWFRVEIQKALAIFVESQSSKEEFSHFFSIPSNKIEVIPLFPGSVVDQSVDERVQEDILSKRGLQKLSFLYYPAQFWAHKNHYNLILAFKEIVTSNPENTLKLVFSGSDRGNKQYVLSVIRKNGLEGKVIVLDFISNHEVFTLYKNATALVMPTFLGPTNMPLLEAQYLDTAVICSDFKGHREICQEGALYADPANPDMWVEAIHAVLDNNFRESLIQKANHVRMNSTFNIQTAMQSLEKALIKFVPIRRTFN